MNQNITVRTLRACGKMFLNKPNEAGFTLMEVLLSVAIILILGSLLVIASKTAIHGSSQSFKTVDTAAMLTRIDRQIRVSAGNVHIPYWANPTPYIDNLGAQLFQSKIGTYIISIRTISDHRRIPRGIEVIYAVNNREMRTVALFSSVVIMDTAQ
jgi:prepilin-type N-terminal cleavage/methylation domain-containing protein